jgi:hypothetical protein
MQLANHPREVPCTEDSVLVLSPDRTGSQDWKVWSEKWNLYYWACAYPSSLLPWTLSVSPLTMIGLSKKDAHWYLNNRSSWQLNDQNPLQTNSSFSEHLHRTKIALCSSLQRSLYTYLTNPAITHLCHLSPIWASCHFQVPNHGGEPLAMAQPFCIDSYLHLSLFSSSMSIQLAAQNSTSWDKFLNPFSLRDAPVLYPCSIFRWSYKPYPQKGVFQSVSGISPPSRKTNSTSETFQLTVSDPSRWMRPRLFFWLSYCMYQSHL